MTKAAVDHLIERLAARGTKHIFGVPGGDCSLDVIESASRHGIRFVLTRAETAAGIAASVTAELTGAPGVVMTTRGPGLAHGVNGIAYASLDRAPLLLLADHYDPDNDYVSHQRFDQFAMLRPLLRGEARLDGAAEVDIDGLLDKAFGSPPGPVYLEITGKGVRTPAVETAPKAAPEAAATDAASLDAARKLLAGAKRPAIVVGLQACETAAAEALRRLAHAWGCPVFPTYKAKGVMPDGDPLTLGFYIGGVAEKDAMASADLVLFYGFDAIECPPQRWRYSTPVVELTAHAFDRHLVDRAATVVGPLAASADALAGAVQPGGWKADELARLRAEIRRRAEASEGGPISPQAVVEAAIRAAPKHTRLTVDAGAHMLPVMHLWDCSEPRQALISRGLATMGFALPAAIGSALADPDRPVIAFTGDGGLMMCSGELGTAAQYGCKLVVVVFNDASLTLIGAKQRRRQLPGEGVDFSPANFASVAEGFGCAGFRVEQPDQLEPAFRAALAAGRPALIDVVVNPHAYHNQIISLRG